MPRHALALSLIISLTIQSGAVAADKRGAKKPAEVVQSENPQAVESVNALLQKWRCGDTDAAKCPIKTNVSVALEGFRWGATKREVLEVYTRAGGLIEQRFDPELRKVSPGSKMQAIEAERENERVLSGQLFTEFDDKHTGYDATFLWKSREYTYANGESLLQVQSGVGVGPIDPRIKRFFFFFGGVGDSQALWKIYEELPLGASSPFGKDFQDALNRVASTFGAMGRVRTAGQGDGVVSTQIDWQDDIVRVRLVERPDTPNVVGFVVEERRIYDNVAARRTHKVEDPFSLDPAVAGATSGGISDPTAENAGSAPRPEKPKKKSAKGH